MENKAIATNLDLNDRIDITAKKQAFIILQTKFPPQPSLKTYKTYKTWNWFKKNPTVKNSRQYQYKSENINQTKSVEKYWRIHQ